MYTAITRARVHVWIFDESETRRAPMFEYFQARKLVQSIQESETGGKTENMIIPSKTCLFAHITIFLV